MLIGNFSILITYIWNRSVLRINLVSNAIFQLVPTLAHELPAANAAPANAHYEVKRAVEYVYAEANARGTMDILQRWMG